MKNQHKPFIYGRVIPKYTNHESVYFKPILPMYKGIKPVSNMVLNYNLGGYMK